MLKNIEVLTKSKRPNLFLIPLANIHLVHLFLFFFCFFLTIIRIIFFLGIGHCFVSLLKKKD